ncbi:MAG: RNA polymerase sigma factor [Chitinophagaceae bacterium]
MPLYIYPDLENITYIIKRCIKNEHKYQQIIYEHYRGYALKIVFRYIYRYEKAIDVVTDGFVKMFTHFSKFKIGETENDNEKILMAWLKKIMINTSIDELRRANMLPEIGGISEDAWEITDNNHDADRIVLYNDLIILIKELPPAYRTIFNLYVIDGYTHSEIADILNMPIGTSKSNLSRAKSMLQQSVKKMEEAKLCRM